MPAVSISQLPTGLALTGVELLPAVQDGATIRTTVAQLRSGLAESGHEHAAEDIAGLPATLSATRRLGRRTRWIPATEMRSTAIGGAAAGTVETPSNGVVLPVLDFDADTTETTRVTVALPKAWDGSALAVQLLWTADAGGDVVWSVAGAVLAPDASLDAATGTPRTVTATLTAAGTLQATAEAGPLTLAGASSPDGLVTLTVARIAGDLADTLSADARLIGLRLFYVVEAASDD